MTDEDLKKEISKIQEQIDTLKKEMIERLERIETTLEPEDGVEDENGKDEDDVKDENGEDEDDVKDENGEDEDDVKDDVDPYKKLAKYSYEALNQVKKDKVRAMQLGRNKSDIKDADTKTSEIIKMVSDVIKNIEKIKKQDEERIEINNPLYLRKKLLRYLPGTLRLNLHARGATKWAGFLLTGVGVIILSRGIWDASETLFSIQGSIIIGAAIIILMAWLERKKIFAVFGEG